MKQKKKRKNNKVSCSYFDLKIDLLCDLNKDIFGNLNISNDNELTILAQVTFRLLL